MLRLGEPSLACPTLLRPLLLWGVKIIIVLFRVKRGETSSGSWVFDGLIYLGREGKLERIQMREKRFVLRFWDVRALNYLFKIWFVALPLCEASNYPSLEKFERYKIIVIFSYFIFFVIF